MATAGLPDNIVRESKDRVKTALQNSGYTFPPARIKVNLAPAHLKKEGAGFDLPIAVGILAAMGIVDPGRVEKSVMVGELSLDGRVKPISGCLPMAIQARAAGCGDVFHAGLTYGVVQGWEAEKSLDLAAWAASRVALKLGGRAGIPSLDGWSYGDRS
jgi:predicted ATPase with chaperone activity